MPSQNRSAKEKEHGLHFFMYTIQLLKYRSIGRVTNWATNGSKTALMDVMSFLCVLLDSSTVQLHDSLGGRRACTCSEAGFNSQNSDHA
jgi:hypothetical protein